MTKRKEAPAEPAEEETARVASSDPRLMQASPFPNFTDEDMVSICDDIGAPMDPELRDQLRRRLVEAGAFYRMSRDSFAETRGGQVRRETKGLAKGASVFAVRIERMSSRTKLSAASAAGQLAKQHEADWFNLTRPDLKLDESREEGVDQLASRAGTQFLCDLKGVYRLEAVFSARALAPSGDPGGSVRERSRDGYINQLARIYEETTGKDPHWKLSHSRDKATPWNRFHNRAGKYSGPFFSFVKRNLGIVQPDHGLKDLALGNLIRTALPNRPEKAKPRRA